MKELLEPYALALDQCAEPCHDCRENQRLAFQGLEELRRPCHEQQQIILEQHSKLHEMGEALQRVAHLVERATKELRRRITLGWANYGMRRGWRTSTTKLHAANQRLSRNWAGIVRRFKGRKKE